MDADKHIAEEESLLDRDTYRRIKKMDRATLEGLIQDIFERGPFTAPVPATENPRRYIMTTNKAIIDKLLRYQTVMSWVRSLLSQALITKAEYAKIDTRIAQKYGISSCSIFR